MQVLLLPGIDCCSLLSFLFFYIFPECLLFFPGKLPKLVDGVVAHPFVHGLARARREVDFSKFTRMS